MDPTAVEQVYLDFLEHLPDAFFSTDLSTMRIRHCNRQASELLQRPQRSIVGLHLDQIVHPSCHDRIEQVRAALGRDTHVRNVPLLFQTAAGAPVEVELSSTVQYDEDGSPLFTRSVVRDITDRRTHVRVAEREAQHRKLELDHVQAELAALRQRLGADRTDGAEAAWQDPAHLKALLDQLPFGVLVNQGQADAPHYANRALYDLLGLVADPSTSLRREEYLPDFDPAQHQRRRARILSTGTHEWRRAVRRSNGDLIDCRFTAAAGRGSLADYNLLVVSDETATQQNEQAVEDLLARMAGAPESDFLPILAHGLTRLVPGADGCLVARYCANGTHAELLALHDPDAAFLPLSYPLAGTACGQTYLHGTAQVNGADRLLDHVTMFTHRTSQGYVGVSVGNADGEPIGHLAVFGQVPFIEPEGALRTLRLYANLAALYLLRVEREQQRAALEQRMQAAQKAETLGLLAGGIAHDFNNLLAGISGNTELLLAETTNPAARERLDVINHATQRAATLCRQMLAYAGKGRYVVAPQDINALVIDTTDLVKVTMGPDQRLDVVLGHDLPPVAADAAQLQQVVLNLVTNAADAVRERSGGHVWVHTRAVQTDSVIADGLGGDAAPGTWVEVEVTDNGSGMSPSMQQRIFEPFFSSKAQGRGLGLAAVQGILRSHGGRLALRSAPDQGTTFRVALRATSEPAIPAVPAPDEAINALAGLTVLAVDDDPMVLDVMHAALDACSIECLTARNGAQGLAQLARHRERIAAVVLDLTMPGIDGFETMEGMRGLRPDLPVLLTSGYNQQQATQQYSLGPHCSFLHKPFQIRDLCARLAEVIAG